MSQLSRQAREALELVKDVRAPSPAARLRARQRIFASIATGAVTSTAAAAEAAILAQSVVVLPGASLLASIAGSFAIGLVVGLGGVAATQLAGVVTEVDAPRLDVEVSGSSASPSTPAPELPLLPSAASEPRKGTAAVTLRSAPRRSLSAETAYIETAQLELQRGNADAALVTLSAYFDKHPRGALVEEASAARVVALCSVGRPGEGQSRALEFERMYPKSMLVPRVRQACHSR